MSDKQRLIRTSALIGILTVLSRFTGLVRDTLVARLLGVSRVSDVFWLAFELPNLARSLLGEGALSTFVVPAFARRRLESDKAAMVFANRLMNIIGLVGLVSTVLGIVFSRELFLVFGGYGILSRDQREFGETSARAVALVEHGGQLTGIMFPYLLLIAVGAVMTGVCNGLGLFARPALGSTMLNVAMLAAGTMALVLRVDPVSATTWLAVAVIVGACWRIAVMVPGLRRAGWRWSADFSLKDPGVGAVLRMMFSGLFGMSVSHINVAVMGLLAAYAGPGVKTYLTNGYRLASLPMALTSGSMATAMLPRVTDLMMKRQHAELAALIGFSRRVDLLLTIPASLGLMFFGLPITQLLFQYGEWKAADSVAVYWVLCVMSPSLVLWGAIRLIVPLFHARQDAFTPVRTAAVALAVSISVGVVATVVFDLRHVGLAIADVLATITNYLLLRRHLGKDLGGILNDSNTTEAFWKCLAAGVVAMGGCALLYFGIASRYGASSSIETALRLVPLMALSAVIYFLLCRAFNVPDSDRVVGFIRGRWRPEPAPVA